MYAAHPNDPLSIVDIPGKVRPRDDDDLGSLSQSTVRQNRTRDARLTLITR